MFTELMAEESVLAVLRVFLGDWLRLDHAYVPPPSPLNP